MSRDVRAAQLGREHGQVAATVRERLCEKRSIDRAQVDRILDGVRGDFSVPLHRALCLLLEPAFGAVLGPPGSGVDLLAIARERLTASGPLEQLRELAGRATLLFAPTHSSSFDTIVVALTLARVGLPAGVMPGDRHMYRNRMLGFLIRNLGGWQIDRARTDRVYWLVVMEYCAVLLERGFHSVIFPGGTRNRTNAVESGAALKVGLLRAALRAQHSGRAERPICVVPVTLNHQVVFEAGWIVDYQLSGRANERIVGDELLVWGRLRESARRLRALDQKIAVVFGEPLPLEKYAGIDADPLAADLARAYRKQTVLFPTHLAAAAIYGLLGNDDVQQLRGRRDAFPVQEVHATVARLVDQVRDHLDPGSATDPAGIVAAAQRAFASCHRSAPFTVNGDHVQAGDVGLLWFYRNRVWAP